MKFWNSELLPLYIFFPVSVNRITYANRYLTIGQLSDLNRYSRALIKEIRGVAPEFDDYRIPSVTLYAGSPSMVSQSPDFSHILDNIRQYFHLLPDAEITYRLDPEMASTLERGLELSLDEADHIELRVLSACAEELSAIHYPYHPSDVAATVQYLRSHTRARLSGLLLLGIPGQSQDSWQDTLRFAVAQEFSEIRILFWDPADVTLLSDLYVPHRRPSPEKLPASDVAFWEEGLASAACFLSENGYEHVQNGLFARRGDSSALSRIQLTNPNSLGLGAGASTFIGGNGYHNTEDLSLYEKAPDDFERIAGDFVIWEESDLMRQGAVYLMSGQGLNEKNYRIVYPANPLLAFSASLRRLQEEGYLCEKEGSFFLTAKGLCHRRELAELL